MTTNLETAYRLAKHYLVDFPILLIGRTTERHIALDPDTYGEATSLIDAIVAEAVAQAEAKAQEREAELVERLMYVANSLAHAIDAIEVYADHTKDLTLVREYIAEARTDLGYLIRRNLKGPNYLKIIGTQSGRVTLDKPNFREVDRE